MPNNIQSDVVRRVIAMADAGFFTRRIAKRVGISVERVREIIRQDLSKPRQRLERDDAGRDVQ